MALKGTKSNKNTRLRYAQLLNIIINSTVIPTLFRHSREGGNDGREWGNNVVRVNLKKVEHGVRFFISMTYSKFLVEGRSVLFSS